MVANRVVRVLTVDCSGGDPVVESVAFRRTASGQYNYSFAGTPAPVAIPGTNLVLVAAYGALQVWTTAGVLMSETNTPGDIQGLWPDPADPTKCTVPCWGNWYMDDPALHDSNTVAEFTGIGTATPAMTVREIAYDVDQYVIGSTDPTVASPGLLAIAGQPTESTQPDDQTSVEAVNLHTSATEILTSEDDFIYYDNVGAAPVGGARSVGLAAGLSVEFDASATLADDNVGLRAYFVDHRDSANPELHIVDVPFGDSGVPITEGVNPDMNFLTQGSHGFAVDPSTGRVLVASTVVSTDSATDNHSRYSVVANVVKSPALPLVAAGSPPEEDWTEIVDEVVPHEYEGFYSLSNTGGTIRVIAEVPLDADHVKVGPGPTYLDSADTGTSVLQVSHAQDTGPTFMLDGVGVRMPAWEPEGGTPVGLEYVVTASSTATEYGGAQTFTTQMWAFDLADLTKPGVRVVYASGGPTNGWKTAASNSSVWYRETRQPIFDALKRGDLLLVAQVGSPYYGAVTSKVSSIEMKVRMLTPPSPEPPESPALDLTVAQPLLEGDYPQYRTTAGTVFTPTYGGTKRNYEWVGTSPYVDLADEDANCGIMHVTNATGSHGGPGVWLAPWTPPAGKVVTAVEITCQYKVSVVSGSPGQIEVQPYWQQDPNSPSGPWVSQYAGDSFPVPSLDTWHTVTLTGGLSTDSGPMIYWTNVPSGNGSLQQLVSAFAANSQSKGMQVFLSASNPNAGSYDVKVSQMRVRVTLADA